MPIYNLTTNEEPARGPVEDVLLTQLGLRSDRLVHLGAPHHPVVPEQNLSWLGCLRLWMIESETESAPLFLPIEKPLAIDVTRTKDQPPQRLHPTHLWATKCDQCATKKEQRKKTKSKNMKTNYGMETDPPPQVWSTIGRRILWPSRVLNIKDWFKVWAFIQRLGCPHPRKTNILVSDQMAIPPPPQKMVMWICLTLAPPNTLG